MVFNVNQQFLPLHQMSSSYTIEIEKIGSKKFAYLNDQADLFFNQSGRIITRLF